MNAIETGKLLGLMAQYDYRETSPSDVAAWLRIIGDLPYADCETVVLAYYAECTERMMPAHVRDRVTDVRRERLKNAPALIPPPEVADDPAAYVAWLAAERKKIADGPAALRAVES